MKTCLMVFLMISGSSCYANEWVPYNNYTPVYQLPATMQPYPLIPVPAPAPVIVPISVQYVPVVTYSSVLVEQKRWCLFKRYEWVQVPQVHYVPMGR